MRSRIFPVLILVLMAFSSGCASTPGTSSPVPHTGPTATVPANPTIPTTNGSPAVVWKRTGGIAGMCQTLTIDFNGNYLLQDCKGNASLASGRLNSEQMNQLDDYLNHYEAFEWESNPPKNSADMFNDELIFNGQGSASPTPDEQEIVNQFMASLAAELRTSATPGASAGSLGESGVQGLAKTGYGHNHHHQVQ